MGLPLGLRASVPGLLSYQCLPGLSLQISPELLLWAKHWRTPVNWRYSCLSEALVFIGDRPPKFNMLIS